jgi:hypothetical protein
MIEYHYEFPKDERIKHFGSCGPSLEDIFPFCGYKMIKIAYLMPILPFLFYSVPSYPIFSKCSPLFLHLISSHLRTCIRPPPLTSLSLVWGFVLVPDYRILSIFFFKKPPFSRRALITKCNKSCGFEN